MSVERDGGQAMLRTPNTAADVYEVREGIGFVRRAPLRLWLVRALTHDEGTVRFSAAAPVALVATEAIALGSQSVFDVGARTLTPGPGGGLGGRVLLDDAGTSVVAGTSGEGCGAGAPFDPSNPRPGGGGGGFGTNGAQPGGRLDGGLAAACGPTDQPRFLGGSGGGAGMHGSGINGNPFFGGAGGGALQLSAAGTLTLAGRVTAHGGGARAPIGNGRQGSGGGSGGAVWLEASLVRVPATGGVYANGGAGSPSSASSSHQRVAFSPDGLASLIPADGGISFTLLADGGINVVTRGGSGAAGTVAATLGESSGPSPGGGGGLGRITLRSGSCAGPSEISTQAEFSPLRGTPAFFTVP